MGKGSRMFLGCNIEFVFDVRFHDVCILERNLDKYWARFDEALEISRLINFVVLGRKKMYGVLEFELTIFKESKISITF